MRVPRLLLWYLGDFGGKAGILRLLRTFEVIRPGAAPRVTFGAYDWTLVLGQADAPGPVPTGVSPGITLEDPTRGR